MISQHAIESLCIKKKIEQLKENDPASEILIAKPAIKCKKTSIFVSVTTKSVHTKHG